jgi:hypothetical protein
MTVRTFIQFSIIQMVRQNHDISQIRFYINASTSLASFSATPRFPRKSPRVAPWGLCLAALIRMHWVHGCSPYQELWRKTKEPLLMQGTRGLVEHFSVFRGRFAPSCGGYGNFGNANRKENGSANCQRLQFGIRGKKRTNSSRETHLGQRRQHEKKAVF